MLVPDKFGADKLTSKCYFQIPEKDLKKIDKKNAFIKAEIFENGKSISESIYYFEKMAIE